MLVPDATVPLRCAGAAGVAAGAGVLEAELPLDFGVEDGRDAVGFGRAVCVGLGSGAGARPATSGVSAVFFAGGTTSTLATESRNAGRIAESVAIAAAGAVSVVFAFSPPHALSNSSVAAESGKKLRVVSSVNRIGISGCRWSRYDVCAFVVTALTHLMSKPRTSSLRALRSLVPFVRKYQGRMALGLSCVIVSSAIASAIPWLLRRAVDDLKASAPPSNLWKIAGAMISIALVTGVLRFQMRNILNAISRYVEYDLRNAMFRHLVTLDSGFFGRNRTGDLMARLTNDLSAVRMVAGPAIMYLVNTIAGGIFALIFMLRISPRLTLIAVLPMVLLPIVMAVLGSLIHKRFEAVQEHFGVMTTHAQENISGARIVRAFRQEAAEQAHFAALNDEYLRRNMGLAKLYGLMSPGLQMLAGLGAVAVLGLGGSATLHGEITVGDFVAFGLYLGMLTWPLIALGWVINLFQRGAASMARINEVLQPVASVVSPPVPAVLPAHADRGRELEFRDVGYHYPTTDGDTTRWVLRHVSFTVPAGATVGIVGATGSGKSALMDLVPRFWNPQEGQILIDGVPIESLSLEALRSTIGYVPQETVLFSDTIMANLTYGGNDEIAARAAAAVAQLDTAIVDLPHGYDTVLGERGINLSGGQKQRAAIARALARDPQIVLLDDALSAVDTATEAAILHGLREELHGRTALISTHRVSTVRDATWIVVLDDGRIVEQGTHDGLVAARGRFWQLLRRQQVSEEVDAVSV